MVINIQSMISSTVSSWFQQSVTNSIDHWVSGLTGVGLIVIGFVILLAGRKVVDAVTLVIAIAMIIFGAFELLGINILKLMGI